MGRHTPSEQKTRDGLSRQEHLQRAYDIFAELGAAYDLARVNATLQ